MAMRGILRNLGAKGARKARAPVGDGALQTIDAGQRLAMLDAFEEEEIGWFWATDSENRLIYLSPSAARGFGVGTPVLGQPDPVIKGDGDADRRADDRPAASIE